MLQSLINAFLGRTRVLVSANERVLVLTKGRLHDVLTPGEHFVPAGDMVVERHPLDRILFESRYTRALFAERPDLAERHLTVLQAPEGQAVVAFRDGSPVAMSTGPKQRFVLLSAAGPFTVERFELDATLAVPKALRAHVEAGAFPSQVLSFTVERGQVGLLTVGAQPMGQLAPGVHMFLRTGRPVAVRLVDLRRRTHEVSGQEVLTADRVTIRVNISADYRVADPELATTAVADFGEALHRALQLAFRRTVGQRTLDQMLAEKVSVDAEAADRVRAEMAEIGVEVGDIALKDVVLPGEMRVLLNRVVEATKEAEANVIRRREETQATRALLNTAKVMEENPVMLRLKELETLTELGGQVDSLTVHNGTQGLLQDLVKLRD